jgi:RNA polymerase sigma-70 factor (ECF subfamily)
MLPDEPEAIGLLATMHLAHARRAARTGPGGELVLLGDQDRALWDRGEIELGLRLAARANARGPVGPYAVQAAIAATHARATSATDTDWARIARLYLWLALFDPSPVVELNRAVAVAEVDGPEAGLAIVEAISGLDRYQPFHSTRADLLRRLGRSDEAIAAYRSALELSANRAQRSFLERRLVELGA